MKIYKLPQLAELSENGEYCLGPADLNAGSVYLLYGRLRPKEAARKVTTQAGSEEIIFMIKGSVRVKCGKTMFSVSPGEAFVSKEAQTFLLDNLGDDEAVYIAAGGSSGAARGAVKEPEKASIQAGPEAAVKDAPLAEDDEFEITEEDEIAEGGKE